jgi:hypothetical protein
MLEALLAIVPSISTAVFVWLWRRDKKLVQAAEAARSAAFRELATFQKLVLDLRVVLAQRNRELKDCREKLPPADSLDDFFSGLPKRDPGRDDS